LKKANDILKDAFDFFAVL